jgi:hypothetical protein
MRGTKPIACAVSAGLLLAGSVGFARQQGELSGIHGVPVEGHDIVAGIEIVGTKHIDMSPSGGRQFRERLRANGADLQLGFPLMSQTLCRFKEVMRDVMSEKGFLDVQITHDSRTTMGNSRHRTLKFTIVEGERTRRRASAAPVPTPAERCQR